YTPSAGRVEIRIEQTAGRQIVTTVKDTGCGISPANLPRVFDRFFTTEPRNQVKDYGSGLGLSIAKSIVENHGGTIRAESRPGHGASFIFTLPAAEG
ncbi:MAG: sensor histidine kinase, partial [Lentisphaerota bacterium]